jgi:uncharacterized membrane protein YidH (DUF202 family)
MKEPHELTDLIVKNSLKCLVIIFAFQYVIGYTKVKIVLAPILMTYREEDTRRIRDVLKDFLIIGAIAGLVYANHYLDNKELEEKQERRSYEDSLKVYQK